MVNFRDKIFRLTQLCLIVFILPVAVIAQPAEEKKKIFEKAETYFLYEEYDLANNLYMQLETPNNLNIKYKIGTCYLNIPGEKEKSIPYLEEAVKNASYDAKPESFKEKRAPLDAYFYLAKAYMINNDLEKGLQTLLTFKKLAEETNSKGGMKNLDYIDQQIEACNNAIEFKAKPVNFSKKLLGGDFREGSINDNPAVSYDGNTIVYTERSGKVNSLFFTKKVRGKWQKPFEITAELNAGEDCSSCSLNNDGTELYLYKIDNYDGALYSSNYINGNWTPIKKLNRFINTKYYESHAAVSADGKKLYFTSNREGGQGSLDIYVSEKDSTGDWGPAVNLGTSINTRYNEDTPFITQNNAELYFSSEGHNTMGGYDNFKSQKTGSGWKTPENLGYPINTTDDDKFFQPVSNGSYAFYSMTTGYKKKEIFYMSLGNDVNKLLEIEGKLSLRDTTVEFNNNYKIYLMDKLSGDTLDVGYPNKLTGLYGFAVFPGEFRLDYTAPGYFSHRIDTNFFQIDPSVPVNINVILEKNPLYHQAIVYDKINPSLAPVIKAADPSTLIRNMNVYDVGDKNVKDSDVLYFTVQVIALYNPVDVSYFKYINNIKVMYNDTDKFYRYTTGEFATREEAYNMIKELKSKGYPDDIFVKKVSKQ